MLRLVTCCTVLLLFCGTSFIAAAQDHATAPRVITFNEAVQVALENNTDIRQARNAIDQSTSQLTQRRGDFLPNLNLNVNGSQRFGTTFDQNVGDFVSERTFGMGLGVSTSINAFDGFAKMARLRSAQFNVQGSELDLERTRQDVVFSVVSQYLDLVLSQENLAIQEENLEAQRQQLEQTEEFVRVGTQPRSDLFQQEAQVANAELQVLQAERQFQINEVQLVRTLQLDPFQEYEFEIMSLDEDDLRLEEYELQALLQESFDRRPDLRSQQQSIAAAEQGVREARSGYYPSLNVNASSSGNYTDRLQSSFGDQVFDQRRTESIGFNLSIPIFDRLQTRNQVQQARVQRDNARITLEGNRQNVAIQVREAYLDYGNAQKRLDVTAVQERAAERALEATQERYNVGSATLVELTQAQADFVSAASDRVQARYELVFQQRLIDYYVGVLNPSQPLFD